MANASTAVSQRRLAAANADLTLAGGGRALLTERPRCTFDTADAEATAQAGHNGGEVTAQSILDESVPDPVFDAESNYLGRVPWGFPITPS